MALTASQLAHRKRKMLAILAKQGGSDSKHARDLPPTYAIGRQAFSPQAIRPRVDDPHKRMQRWIQAALMVVLGVKLPLHGVIDGQTRAALLQFQKMAGISQSGAADSRTIEALQEAVGLPAPTAGNSAQPADNNNVLVRVRKAKGGKGGGTGEEKGAAEVDGPEGQGEERHSFEDSQGQHHYGEADAHTLWTQQQAPAAKALDPAQLAMQRFLHAEAVHAVMALAFARDFVRQEADRLGRPAESAIFAEMLHFWEQARLPAAEPPAWMTEIAKLAADKQDHAVAKARAAWQAHAGGPKPQAGAEP